MDNVLSVIGDTLLVKTIAEIKGKIILSSFTDVLTGLTTARTVNREYRMSQDNIFWDEWAILTNENLALNTYVCNNKLYIEVRYTRTGTDTTGDIVFTNISFTGNHEDILFVCPTLSSSIFSSCINSDDTINIETNLFKKLYYRGVIPNYITRGDNRSYKTDADFASLFFSISKYFSLFISLFKRFENIKTDFELLFEQVKQYGIYFNEKTVTLSELQYLAQNILSQAQQRGTKMIFTHKSDILPNGSVAEIDGEFIRLTRECENDELLYENIPNYKIGWCMRQSSPMYKGTSQAYNLNKTKENTSDFQSLNNYLISYSEAGNKTANIISSGGKNVLRLYANGTGAQVGLGRILTTKQVDDNFVLVDTQMDYEITFAFKINSGVSYYSNILFAIEGFNEDKNLLNDAFINPNTNNVYSTFMNQQMSVWRMNQWYYVRGIIHAYSSNITENVKLNIGFGNNLVFSNYLLKYIVPKIQIVETNGAYSTVDIWDYKIRPLIRGKNIVPLQNGEKDNMSLGFIQASNFLYTYYQNNNNNMSQDDITDIINKYLYPYQTVNIFTTMINH